MLLGALVDAGVDLAVLQQAVDAVTPEPLRLNASRVARAGIAATRVTVEGTKSTVPRTLGDIRTLLDDATQLSDHVRSRAHGVFERLAEAEAAVHGTTSEEVHFHEVGALDAIADVVGVCAGFAVLGLDGLVVSPVALGGGRVRAAHGSIPVPGPAVVRLLAGAPTYGGPVDVELTTPTGAVLLAEHATSWGYQPPMSAAEQAFGAGGRDIEGHPNVLRLVLGAPVPPPSTRDHAVLHARGSHATGEPTPSSRDHAVLHAGEPAGSAVVIETNVDDLDPRLWPGVLAKLLDSGASDAWLTPILMKKGRPAHTLHVLVAPDRCEAVERAVLTQTTAIGLRRTVVGKRALDREQVDVEVDGHTISVKLAYLDGEVVNAQPEYEHVAAAARALDRPAKLVLAQAISAADQTTKQNKKTRNA
jgi:uncharacterized protein (TIGR00299 family) protein